MGRRERPLDASSGSLYEFARALRDLRRTAGQPSYRRLAATTHYSVATLARAAAGRHLPTLKVTLAYVAACGGDPEQWRERWSAVARQLGRADAAPPRVPPRVAVELMAPEVVAPMQLPPVPRGFVGRSAELGELDALLAEAAPPPLVVIVGGPGSGKTALAVQWAYRVREKFAHGVLFADLHGSDPNQPPVRSGNQLDSFLHATGVRPGLTQFDLDARCALWRSVLSERQVLLILDDAANAEQVRPLVATGPGSATVITSRARLAGIVARDGAARISLGPMPPDEADQVLRRHLAPEQRLVPPALLTRMAELCAWLPLALRVAAERAARHPHDGVDAVLGRLAEENDRLNLLCADDGYGSMRATFSWSYRELGRAEAAMFRLLGLAPGGDIRAEAICALAASSAARTRQLMDRLVAANLVDEARPGRFRMHDLLRLYAAERATLEDPARLRSAAICRLLYWYLLSVAEAATHLVPPTLSAERLWSGRVDLDLDPGEWCVPRPFASRESALDWCDVERANLSAAVRKAAEVGDCELAWRLPAVLAEYLAVRRRWADLIELTGTGLAVAQAAGDRTGEVLLRCQLGAAYARTGRVDECVEQFELAVRHATGAARASTLVDFGALLVRLGRVAEGMARFRQALRVLRRTPDRHTEGLAQYHLGRAYSGLGRGTKSRSLLTESLSAFRDSGDSDAETRVLAALAGIDAE